MGGDECARGHPRGALVKRGEVCWAELETEGRRPVCILTRDEAIPTLQNVVVATITGRKRGLESEVALGPEDGMPRECAISLDNLRTVPKALLTEPITMLGPEKLAELCRALNTAVDC
jgi:mRNA interferase MazF